MADGDDPGLEKRVSGLPGACRAFDPSRLLLVSYWFPELFLWTFPQGYTGLQVLIPRSPLEKWLTCCLVMLHW